MSLNISEQNIVIDLINKIRIKFYTNPNKIDINPGKILYITDFIFKELNKYELESEYIKISQCILKNLMEYYPDNILDKEQIDYFIDILLYDFYKVLNF